jgi:outer membrane receptor protein involved in Fe transport
LNLAWRYVGERDSNFPQSITGAANLDSYNVVDLAAGIGRERWRLTAFVRNLTNEEAFLSAQSLGAAILQPRSAGIGFEYRK